jgi:hypothetical protein
MLYCVCDCNFDTNIGRAELRCNFNVNMGVTLG